jgi:hypothetical protein
MPIKTDSRGRLTLRGKADQWFLVGEDDQGTITLTPVQQVRVADLPDDIRDVIMRNREHPEDSVPFVPRSERQPRFR